MKFNIDNTVLYVTRVLISTHLWENDIIDYILSNINYILHYIVILLKPLLSKPILSLITRDYIYVMLMLSTQRDKRCLSTQFTYYLYIIG